MAAPKGNKFALGNKGGKPRRFTLQQVISLATKYLEETPIEQYTVTGLALALKTTRKTLLDYENIEEYGYAIKMCKTWIEHAYELALRKSGKAGDIFALKNMGWTDKQEIEVNDITQLTKDELIERIRQAAGKKVAIHPRNTDDKRNQAAG